MRRIISLLIVVLSSQIALSQDVEQVIAPVNEQAAEAARGDVPRLIKYGGTVSLDTCHPNSGSVALTFALYSSAESKSPLWVETQVVTITEKGQYSVLLGNSSVEGLPSDLFAGAEPRWLGVKCEDAIEAQRSILVSVPYALKARTADNALLLGGRPVTDFALVSSTPKRAQTQRLAGPLSSTAPEDTGAGDNGTLNFLAKFSSTGSNVNLIDSAILEVGGNLGVGTLSPQAKITIGPGGSFADPGIPMQMSTLGAGTYTYYGVNKNGGAGFGFGYDNGTVLGTGAVVRQLNSDPMMFVMNGTTEAMRLNAAGNLGVGNTNPQSKLMVGPGGSFGDPGIPLQMSTLGTGTYTYYGVNKNGAAGFGFGYDNGTVLGTGAVIRQLNGDPMMFVVNGLTEAMRITNTGDIAIGKTVPTARLDVSQAAAGSGSFSVGAPPPAGIRGDATSATGVTAGVLGISSAVLGRGVLGEALATTGQNMGVFGVAVNSPDGSGVWGEATNTTGDAVGVFGRSSSNSGTGIWGEATAATGDAVGVAGRSLAAGGTGVQGEVSATTGENYALAGRVFNSTNTASTAGMFINTGSGSLLVGRISTAGGAANLFRVDTAGKGFFNGGTQTGGADFAESVTVKNEKSEYQPGDVIAIDTTGVRRFTKVAKPYSTLVAGIYSTKPGVLATPHTMDDPRITNEEIPLAVVGIVPCKVSNENGEIHVGDLLVSSSREGYAMKGTDQKRMNGAVIGKALQPMKGATGVIEVLVSLQ